MLLWLQENLGTILVSGALLAMVVGIIKVLIRDKKQGKSSCGGSCAHCAMGGACHGHK